jgi:hypothetical protein
MSCECREKIVVNITIYLELSVRCPTQVQSVGSLRRSGSRVSFFMNKFRRLGFISFNGSIEVHNSLLNLVLHEEPHIET